MTDVNLIAGSNAADTLQGGAGDDLLYGFDPSGAQAQAGAIAATRIATGLSAPLYAAAPPGDATRLFIVERDGQIEILDLRTEQLQATPFLDISNEVSTGGEQGLLGLAFHPDFATNGLFYVNLTDTGGDTEIRSYRASPVEPNLAEAASGRLVLGVDQPDAFTNHKGGWLGFGPDGYLYIALGDGGGAGDPLDNAQNVGSLLGKILRVDVNVDAFLLDPARNYAIPADNPFADTAGADEVWAYGLRNPWRDSFDRATGDFFIADVGQNAWEEVDIGTAGANYGWRIFEGPAVFAPGTPTGGSAAPPVAFYSHDLGQAITGGYVYRGESEGLHGQYFFADFASGRVWTLRLDGPPSITERTAQIDPDAGAIDNPVSFGEDARGNLHVVDFDGDIFRLTPQSNVADGADRIQGDGGDDFIYGGTGADTLLGEAGADTINGQSGNDVLDGGAGDDMLIGGRGGDVFVFAPGAGRDAVADFGPGDSIRLLRTDLPDFAAVLAASRPVEAGTIIAADTANTITLQGVSLTSLDAGDFLFT